MNTYKKYCPNVFIAACDEQHSRGEIIEITTSRGSTHDCEVWNYLGQKDGKYLYSITRADGTNHQTRAAARAQKYEDWAEAAQRRSDDAFQRSENAVAGIPFGQPILVGHHSESRHRNALKRSQSAMGKCVEEADKARSHESKAEYWERKAETIDLSMPESIEYFEAELAKAEEYHAGVKSGKYPREHAYTLTYAKKAVNELADKVRIARKLWGDPVEPAPSDQKIPTPTAKNTENQKNNVNLQQGNDSQKTPNDMTNRQLAKIHLDQHLDDAAVKTYITASHFETVGKSLVCFPDGSVSIYVTNSADTKCSTALLVVSTPDSHKCDCELCAPFKAMAAAGDPMTVEQVAKFKRDYNLGPRELEGRNVLDMYNPEALEELIQDYRERAYAALNRIPQGFFTDEQ